MYTGTGGWVTNDPEAAKRLRSADMRYERAKIMAGGLTLTDKIEAYRVAKIARQAEYDAVLQP